MQSNYVSISLNKTQFSENIPKLKAILRVWNTTTSYKVLLHVHAVFFFQGDKPWDMCKEVFNCFFFQTFKWLRLTMPVGACNNVFRRISTGLNTMGARHSNSRCRTSSESELSRFTFVIKKNNEWNHLYTSINEMTGINITVFSLLQSSLCSQAG